MPLSRRSFLRTAAASACTPILSPHGLLSQPHQQGEDDSPAYTLTIATAPIELAPTASSPPLPTTASSPMAHSFALNKASASPSRSTTRPTPPNNSTGTAETVSTDIDGAAEERARPSSHPTAAGKSPSSPAPPASASTTPMSAPEPISQQANTAASSAPPTSNPHTTPATTTARSFSPSKNSNPP